MEFLLKLFVRMKTGKAINCGKPELAVGRTDLHVLPKSGLGQSQGRRNGCIQTTYGFV